jgi:lipopolysaccharide transport system ATP-binding protein
MSSTIIKVENLSKQYKLGERESYKTLRETIVNLTKLPFRFLGKSEPKAPISSEKRGIQSGGQNPLPETIWALKDISIEIKQGEVLGVIGRNGAGKSTLLKVLSKITEPTKGRVELRGRVGSLLEVGSGFHPELTGHENIYLYGAILGMDRWEVTRKFDEIVAFAELEKFIDTPVKRYSSGMYMRLAFAVAAHLDTEILLVDEVLAVGDAAFQTKCMGKMGDVSKQGRTVLFVSHSLASIASLCDTAVLLDNGRIKSTGPSADVVEQYLSTLTSRPSVIDLRNFIDRRGTGEVRIVNAAVLDQHGHPCTRFNYGDDICFEYHLEPVEPSPKLITVVWIRTASGIPVLHLANHDDPSSAPFKVGSEMVIRCWLKDCKLLPGNYLVSLWIAPDHYHDTDFVGDALQFRMEQGKLNERGFDMSWKHGIFHSETSWIINSNLSGMPDA